MQRFTNRPSHIPLMPPGDVCPTIYAEIRLQFATPMVGPFSRLMASKTESDAVMIIKTESEACATFYQPHIASMPSMPRVTFAQQTKTNGKSEYNSFLWCVCVRFPD